MSGRTLVTVLLLLAAHLADARVLRVSKQGPYRLLSQAVAAARAGDTIRVAAGVYAEPNVLIQKPLVLLGEKGAVLDGQSKYEILTIAKTRVVVQGFTFRRSGRSNMDDFAGIKVHDAHGSRFVNNIFEETFFGIHLSNTDSAYIAGNRLKATAANEYELGNGIHLWKCRWARIEYNHITGHRDGIYFEFVTNSQITRNQSRQNMRYGLHFMFCDDNTYESNVFSKNGAGVAVMYTKGVRMLNNVFEENWGAAAYGLLLKDIRDSEVRGNRFLNNTSGIYQPHPLRKQPLSRQWLGHSAASQLRWQYLATQQFRWQYLRHCHQRPRGAQYRERQLLGQIPGLRPQPRRGGRCALLPREFVCQFERANSLGHAAVAQLSGLHARAGREGHARHHPRRPTRQPTSTPTA
jgi:nitrous oxidase accessory protein